MTRRGEPTITQSVPTPPHPHAVSPSHLRDRLVDKKAANPVHHPLQRQEVPVEPLDNPGRSKRTAAVAPIVAFFVSAPLTLYVFGGDRTLIAACCSVVIVGLAVS